ncbi:hypothetical protein DACRYDRAFT_48498, partial [Dacryopinax primogenitus]
FRCDACGDTVKKPKLDQHSYKCHSSVTCIDCSKTFAGPVEWKSHTSCISEAEKYQKGLYKGPKQGDRQQGQQYSNGRGQHQQRGRGRGGFGQGMGMGRRMTGTGANGTPLGTPSRMSPISQPTAAPEEKEQPAVAPAVEVVKEVEENGKTKKEKKAKAKKEKAVESEPGTEEVAEAPKTDAVATNGTESTSLALVLSSPILT